MITLRKVAMGAVGAIALAAPSIVAAEVAFVAILSIAEDRHAEFDRLANQMVDAASENDGLLIYEFARSGDRVIGYERYVDAAAHGRHEEIIAEFIPALMDVAAFETIVTLSELTDDHRAAFEAIGAVIGVPIAGFAKETLSE